MTSPVMRQMMKQSKRKGRRRSISIRGVPHDADRVFIRFLYSSCYDANEMEEYILHLFLFSHVYVVLHLKKECDNGLAIGTAFYKLEMVKIQLISADGNKIAVDVEDYRKACPDAIAHSAARIISRVNAAGEKTTNALKSLCWRCNDLQVEEASLIGIDALGFDLRVCSGTQVQTLRFTFNSQATSEYSAERHLNDVLFPRNIQKVQKLEQARRRES